jgi:selenocysteine lyase/cysteine desulfurase
MGAGATATASSVDLAALREREFPIVGEYAYLNAASQGPWPNRTVRALHEFAAASQFPNTPGRAAAIAGPEPAARARLARLLGVGEETILFTGNTTHGMNICAQGIDWRPGDNVVLHRREFPSLSYAWLNLRRRGVEVRLVPVEGAGPALDDLMAAVDSRTRAVACSAISWDTGYRLDLEELGRRCRERGCLLILDGIQVVGARRLDLAALGVSALCCHGYKWLMSGFGVGALYVAPSAVDQIRPTFIGSQAVVGGMEIATEEYGWKPGAARYGAGGANRTGLVVLDASLSLIEEVGIDAIEAHDQALAERLYAGLRRKGGALRVVSSDDPARRSAVITFTLGDRARDEALIRRLEERKIILALRPLGLRASPHLYNSEEEIDRLLEALP